MTIEELMSIHHSHDSPPRFYLHMAYTLAFTDYISHCYAERGERKKAEAYAEANSEDHREYDVCLANYYTQFGQSDEFQKLNKAFEAEYPLC